MSLEAFKAYATVKYMVGTKKAVSRRIIIVTLVMLGSVFFVLLTAYVKYIYAKDYDFLVEAPCNSSETTCFVRDCLDYCPPNELGEYSVYLIPAKRYNDCTDNACVNICQNKETAEECILVECNIENGDDCTS